MTAPRLVITCGDPCGVGPEVTLRALSSLRRRFPTIVVGDRAVLEQTARRLRLPLPFRKGIELYDCGHRGSFKPGASGRLAGKASLNYLAAAVHLLKAGGGALVTGPVTKWAIEQVKPGFVGQTEYLAEAFRVKDVVMAFASPGMRIVLLTRHVALRDVSRLATPRLLRTTLALTREALRKQFGIRDPRIAVCGLNPHAGEGGLFGDEERRVLAPVLRQLRRKGWKLEGPVAADGFFANPMTADVVLGWYHDQVLIPFKMAARDTGCQLSIGLPIIRTSPDHGSALDIAGSGRANPGAMAYAINLAADLLQGTRRSGRHAHRA